MANLYDRNYSVLVGPVDEPGILIERLRVSFSIEKSSEPYPNSSIIEITNLGEKSRSLIEEKRSAIIVNAGYGKELKNIFVGDIAKVSTKKSGTDTILTIEAGDGAVAYSDAKLDASFAPGTRFSQVLDAIVKRLGVASGKIKGVNMNDQFLQGITLSGPVRSSLDKLTKRQRLEWSIQDNQLQILPPDEATDETAVVLSGATGLIGTPFKTKIVNQDLLTKKDGKETKDGVTCVCLLNPEIRPGRLIKLESKFVSGIFKVTKVRHNGDTHGNNWFTEVEAKIAV